MKLFNRLHILLAGLVPLLGMFLIALASMAQGGSKPAASPDPSGEKPAAADNSHNLSLEAVKQGISKNAGLAVVSGGGLLGVVLCSWLWRRIEQDAAALTHLAIDEPRRGGGLRSSKGSSPGSRMSSSRRR